LSTDEGSDGCLHVHSETASSGHRTPDPERLGLPLDRDPIELLVVERLPRSLVRPLSDDDGTDRRGPLEPGCDVQRIAEDVLSFAFVATEADEHLPLCSRSRRDDREWELRDREDHGEADKEGHRHEIR
jgi:hypothetical protein